MGKCNFQLWEVNLPGIPMPEGATMEMYWAAQDALRRDADLEWQGKYLASLRKLRENSHPHTQDAVDELTQNELRKGRGL